MRSWATCARVGAGAGHVELRQRRRARSERHARADVRLSRPSRGPTRFTGRSEPVNERRASLQQVLRLIGGAASKGRRQTLAPTPARSSAGPVAGEASRAHAQWTAKSQVLPSCKRYSLRIWVTR